MNTRQIAIISIMSALVVSMAYSKGLALSSFPGVFELMTVLIFVTGYIFGLSVGITVGSVSLAIYMIIPYPFAHPAAWLYSISPVLLIIMMALGALFGITGAVMKHIINPAKVGRFSIKLGIIGLVLTLIYDVGSSIGFAIAYGMPLIESLWLTFVPLYYPWPPIIHTITNTAIFAFLSPTLIHSIHSIPEVLNTKKQ